VHADEITRARIYRNAGPSHLHRGFSLVELLAVVLILAVLAAVAVPLYMNTRKTSAARACKANIAAISAAESAYALRNGCYNTVANLVGQPEGLSSSLKCPLDNSATYKVATTQGGSTDISATTTVTVYINCPNAASHSAVLTSYATTDWQVSMSAVTTDSLP